MNVLIELKEGKVIKMTIQFDVAKISVELACKIRDEAAKKGWSQWSIITVDPESDDGEIYVMIRNIATNENSGFMVRCEKGYLGEVALTTEVF